MLYCGLTLHSPKALVFHIKHTCLLALSERGQFPPLKGFSPFVLKFPLSRRAKSFRMLGLSRSLFAPSDICALKVSHSMLVFFFLPKYQSGVIMVWSLPNLASPLILTVFIAYVALQSKLICSTSGFASAATCQFWEGYGGREVTEQQEMRGKWKLLTREHFAECCNGEEKC